MAARIVTVDRGSQLESEVCRFRYRIYVEEMRRHQVHANHAERMIREPLDRCSTVFAAIDTAGDVVGTMRYTAVGECPGSVYTALYRMRSFGAYFPDRCSFTTKLMVAAPLRRSALAARLALAAYDLGVSRGHAVSFIDCNEPLVGFFRGLGYLPLPGAVEHPEYGRVQAMVVPVRDLRHLENRRSPFLRRARALGVVHEDSLATVSHVLQLLEKGLDHGASCEN